MCVCVCVCVCVCMWCAHVLRMSFGLQRGTIHIMEEEVLGGGGGFSKQCMRDEVLEVQD